MAEGVDYSGARPSSFCLKGAGKRFVGRYFGPGGSWKHATRAEVAAHKAAGLAVVALAEGFPRDPLDGEPRGRAHAIMADSAVRQAGMGDDIPIYFAVDFNAQPGQYKVIGRYLYGIAQTIGLRRVGLYAGYNVIKWADEANVATWFFQTYAWSGGRWWKGNHIEQYRNKVIVCGGEVDLCRSKRDNFGQWPPYKKPAGTAPTPPSDSTVETGWDFTQHVDHLANLTGDLGRTVDGAARDIESLS